MKRTHWKEAAELIGLFAILASLIFVALQLRQQEELLQLEIRNYIVSSSLELHASLAENAEVWAKGNAGEELDPAERVAYQELLVGLNDWYFHTRLVLLEIAPYEEAQMFALYGGFLAENPGAYASFVERESKLGEYRASLDSESITQHEIANQWLETIEASVAAIKRHQAELINLPARRADR